MRKIVDLSGTIESDLWGYYSLPGLEELVPPVKVETIATVREHDFFASVIVDRYDPIMAQRGPRSLRRHMSVSRRLSSHRRG